MTAALANRNIHPMQFGICTTIANASAAKSAGWDFIEENAQTYLAGQLEDDAWDAPARIAASALPVPSVNMLVPAALKIVGPQVDTSALERYISRALRRARALGVHICVFGSGGARAVPEYFDRAQARDQIIRFLKYAAPIAADSGVTIAIEALNRKECNIINTFPEAAQLAAEVAHPACQCVFDTYHFWAESEPLDHVRQHAPQITHVHVADLKNRAAPGESGLDDYRPLLEILKAIRYDKRISVEAVDFDIAAAGSRVLDFLRDAWQRA
jgi:sugar phosphate isomerase/epimerase